MNAVSRAKNLALILVFAISATCDAWAWAADIPTREFVVGPGSEESKGFTDVHDAGDYEVTFKAAQGYRIIEANSGEKWESRDMAEMIVGPPDPKFWLSISKPKEGLSVKFTGKLVPIGSGPGSGTPPVYEFEGNVVQIRLRFDVNGDGDFSAADDSDPDDSTQPGFLLLGTTPTTLNVQVNLQGKPADGRKIRFTPSNNNLLIRDNLGASVTEIDAFEGTKQYQVKIADGSAGEPLDQSNPPAGELTITAVIQFPGTTDNPNPVAQTADKAKLAAGDIKVKSIDFFNVKDEGFAFVTLKDEDGRKYPSPDWLLDRDEQSPAGYVRKSKMLLNVAFESTFDKTVYVRGACNYKDDDGNPLEFATRSLDRRSRIDDWACTRTLKDSIDFQDLTITWTFSLDQNGPFKEIGKTTSPLYVTLDRSVSRAAERRFRTVLHIGCENGKGKTDADAAVAAIYDKFKTRVVTTWRGRPAGGMTYYKTPAAECTTVKGLINGEDGKCAAWADLLRDILQVQGITGVESVGLRPDAAAIDPNPVKILVPVGFRVIRTLPAQGGNPTVHDFQDHAVVVYKKSLYDPSYGDSIVPPKAGAIDFIAYQVQSFEHVEFFDRSNRRPFLIKSTNPAFKSHPLIGISNIRP